MTTTNDPLDRSPAAVLFDMDGTLLDSEPLWTVALRDLAHRRGGVLTDDLRAAMVGNSHAASMALLYQALGVTDPDHTDDEAFLFDRMAELFATDLTWRPGAAALLTAVRQAGIPTALVTSTGRRLVEIALTSTLGHANFDVVICGDEVAEPKPHPEPYLTAAATLGVPPGRCVALEDSPAGVTSAHTAGTVVVAVAGEVPLPRLPGIHPVPTLLGRNLRWLAGLVPVAAGGTGPASVATGTGPVTWR